jgi:hypothetical protein
MERGYDWHICEMQQMVGKHSSSVLRAFEVCIASGSVLKGFQILPICIQLQVALAIHVRQKHLMQCWYPFNSFSTIFGDLNLAVLRHRWCIIHACMV